MGLVWVLNELMLVRSLGQSLAHSLCPQNVPRSITQSTLFILQTRKLDLEKSDLSKVIWWVNGRAKSGSRHPSQALFLLYHTSHSIFPASHDLRAEWGWDAFRLVMSVLSCWVRQSQGQEHPGLLAPLWSGAGWAWGEVLLTSHNDAQSPGLSHPARANFHRALSNRPLIINLHSGSWSSRKVDWIVSPSTAFKCSGNRQNLCLQTSLQSTSLRPEALARSLSLCLSVCLSLSLSAPQDPLPVLTDCRDWIVVCTMTCFCPHGTISPQMFFPLPFRKEHTHTRTYTRTITHMPKGFCSLGKVFKSSTTIFGSSVGGSETCNRGRCSSRCFQR